MAKIAEEDELRTAKHRDAHMDDAAEHVEFGSEVFESETELLSMENLRLTWARLREHPLVGRLIRALDAVGPDRVEGLLERVFRGTAEREVDEFGCDRQLVQDLIPFTRFMHDKYFRVESRGIEHIPDQGRALLVANHSGTLPYDGAMIVATVHLMHPARRLVRSLVEDFVYHSPYVGTFMSRVGAVRACQENAQRLLNSDEAVLVFPEGVKGIGKLYRKRYRLQRFGRGGAVKLALSTGAPIVPVSVVGAEEAMPLLSKVGWLAKPLGLPYIPVTPTLPWLGPLGLIPYPTKWYIDFGEPLNMSQYGAGALKDRVLVNRLNEQVRGVIQTMIDERLAERESIFAG